MKKNRLYHAYLLISLVFCSAGCNMPAIKDMPNINEILSLPALSGSGSEPLAGSFSSLGQTTATFRVENPPGTPKNGQFYLTLLDEVTGLALNSSIFPMKPSEEMDLQGEPEYYSITLAFPIGSLIKYRYERQADGIRVAEHLSDGSPVRYRMLHITGQVEVQDVISRWTDSDFMLPFGRIQGQIIDMQSQLPIPNILVEAGGAQTLSTSDGSFMLEGLPPGIHLLVAYAMDGSYQTFQQGANVAEGSTTPALISMNRSEFINVVFVVKAPEGTPPVVPLRMAGNLLQLGNTYANLSGGMSTLAAEMPMLTTLPDGRYTVTVALPIGADISYKYTLGDGFWNAEHGSDGSFRLRQMIVPDQTILVEDTIETWNDISGNSVTFDLKVPAETPAADIVTIQFNPLFGWTEPLPMWKLAENRWAYVLYSPLNLPGGLSYRYCRNYQCADAGELSPVAGINEEHKIQIINQPQTLSDQVTAWSNWSPGNQSQIPTVQGIVGRGDGYRTGFELATGYHPTWGSLYPQMLDSIQASQANLVVLTPTWSYGYGSEDNLLPILAPLPGKDPYWTTLASWIDQTQTAGINAALRPEANFPISSDKWWEKAVRDESWWQVWFEQYRSFAIHFADLAERTNTQTLLLGGEWVLPALPEGKLPDGTASNSPGDSNLRWETLLNDLRSHYHGQIGWVIPAQYIDSPPEFIGMFDRIYVDLYIEPDSSIEESIGQDLTNWLDVSLLNLQFQSAMPLILGVSCSSNPDLQTQLECYSTSLAAVNSRDWISGFISLGYYPPVELQDQSASVHGKPAAELLNFWYPEMVK